MLHFIRSLLAPLCVPALPSILATAPARSSRAVLLSGLLVLGACVTHDLPLSAPAQSTSDVSVLGNWVTGSFSNQAQHLSDDYFADIRIRTVRIWRNEGDWFYVENAEAGRLDAPYLQAVFQLAAQADGTIHRHHFRLNDPARFAGGIDEPAKLSGLVPSDLTPVPGCLIILKRVSPTRFEGATVADNCTNTRRGASHMRNNSFYTEDRFGNWDRGYTDDRAITWGSAMGPYVFDRLP